MLPLAQGLPDLAVLTPFLDLFLDNYGDLVKLHNTLTEWMGVVQARFIEVNELQFRQARSLEAENRSSPAPISPPNLVSNQPHELRYERTMEERFGTVRAPSPLVGDSDSSTPSVDGSTWSMDDPISSEDRIEVEVSSSAQVIKPGVVPANAPDIIIPGEPIAGPSTGRPIARLPSVRRRSALPTLLPHPPTPPMPSAGTASSALYAAEGHVGLPEVHTDPSSMLAHSFKIDKREKRKEAPEDEMIDNMTANDSTPVTRPTKRLKQGSPPHESLTPPPMSIDFSPEEMAGRFDETESSFQLLVAEDFRVDDLDMDSVRAEQDDVEMLLDPIDTPQPVNAGGEMNTTALRKKEVEEVARVEESKDQPTVTRRTMTMTTRSMARKLNVAQEHLEPEQSAGKMRMRLRSDEKKARAKTVKQAKVEQQARVNIEKSQARPVRKQSKGKPTASGKGRARK
ncbi:hypothetical protein CALVIDRAFT_561594 [Calocera viscosa TUFC12733]|uniref:Uncharacterized protein n=1 Tax=Calocera viscosa (strain TUFC12733) TaxID=1330018 RepID=A0A167PWV4_CALVF|nr:hypothetical protein CALVIDRAFT_561594 [Calocera viscosa TUFC12733]